MADNYIYDGEVYPDHLSATMLNHPGIPEELRTEFKQALEAPTEPAGALKSDEGAPPTTRIVVHPEAPQRDIPDFTNQYGTPEDKQIWPERLVSSLWNAVKAPGEAVQGDLPPWAMDTEGNFHTSPQMIEKANDLAGLMVMGPAPVAAKMADGTLGSFAGVRSKGFADPKLKSRLYEAQNMELDKAHPEAIFYKTGFFRGAEGRWRYEINDQKAALKESAFQKNTIIDDPRTGGEVNTTFTLKENPTNFFGGKKVVTLDQVLDHPELYNAYPELKNVKVEELPKQLVDKNIKGMISGDTLYLAPDLDPAYARSVILHEVQHKIQEAEGFARGGSASEFITPALEKAEQDYKQVRQESLSNIKVPEPELWIQAIKEHLTEGHPQAKELSIQMERLKSMFPEEFEKLTTIAKSDTLLREARREANVKYKRLAGEAEARNVQKRMDFSAYERSMSFPVNTEDTPRFLQQRLKIGERLPSNSEGEMKAANDVDAFQRKVAPNYDAASRNQTIQKLVDKDTRVGDFDHWKNIARKENINGEFTSKPNAYAAARKHSEGGKTTMLISPDGRRTVFQDGVKVVREKLQR